ncbi:MAG: hypothetical protein SVU32_01405 [Candidatus Nanohaloarchaea archaeon]|nr:hypothetical protein [Candidatus Nanohaloarchaea archaeon]
MDEDNVDGVFEKLLLTGGVEPEELLQEMAWPGTYMYMLRPTEEGVQYDTENKQIILTPDRIERMARRVESEQGKEHYYRSRLLGRKKITSDEFEEYARKSYELMQHLEEQDYTIEPLYRETPTEELDEFREFWDDRYFERREV